MTSFIHDVLKHLQNKSTDFSQLSFILPSKRAGVFLKNELSQITSSTFLSPEILSIEEFVETLSQLRQISNTELLFEFYSVYLNNTPKDKAESFDSFSKWAQILIQDFNEIDRYLINQNALFEYLGAIKELNHWSVSEHKTDMVKRYLTFWNSLKTYYAKFTTSLVNKGVGYQGLIYREAVEQLEDYIQLNSKKQHIFVGFNALNSAESIIIQEFIQNTQAEIYWDVSESFINHNHHDAGHFIRAHKTQWHYFKTHPFHWINDHYATKKNITVVGTPKNIGQVKYIGELLETLKTKKGSLKSTAVVLGDESLLIPVINSIPKSIEALNITMGFPLNSIPLTTLFERLFLMHKDGKATFYYKDVVAILSHEFIIPLFAENKSAIEHAINSIQSNNLIFLTAQKIASLFKADDPSLSIVFDNWENNATVAIDRCLELIMRIKTALDKQKNSNLLSLEYLFRFNEVFNALKQLNTSFGYVSSINVLFGLYKELLSTETLDFQGEPLQGLQIMGMLESRVLDFETVIISSVNEGILPSGKSNNSFIPFDIKLEYGLPTYKEKDAVYTYHFYRLLQRAKNIYIIYNTEPDTLNGGEKSRFITQMEIENIHHLDHNIITPRVTQIQSKRSRIKKTDTVLHKISALAKKGFSPSSLTNYIRNPLDFYYQKVLGIKEKDDVEEIVAANTLGTVVHETLKDLYLPLLNTNLRIEDIKNMIPKIDDLVKVHFKAIYKQGDIDKGKNLIIFEIAKRYVQNFLQKELGDLKNGHSIKVISVEIDVETTIEYEGLNFPITLKGQIDRIDEFDGTLRIIDYKTGRVTKDKVEIIHWEDITSDYDKYSKSFQILLYAYIMNRNTPFNQPIEAGIISFKNLNEGFLKFSKKESVYDKNKVSLISEETLLHFEKELVNLIKEICNPKIDFVEKEI